MKFSRDDTRVAKATAVILMCMHHLFAFPNRFPEGVTYISMFPWDLEYDLGCVGKICVAMFVFLSGFGTYLAMEKTSAPWKMVGRKILGLYKKYWAVFLVFIPVAVLLGDPQVKLTARHLLFNLIARHTSYNGEWWFLPPFLVLTAVSPLLVPVIRRSKWDWLLFAALYLGEMYLLRKLVPDFWYKASSTRVASILYNAFAFIPGFWLGCIVAKHRLFDRYLEHVGPWGSLAVEIACVAVSIWLGREMDVLLAPVMCVATVGFARGIPLLQKIKGEIGEVSTEIWLTHSFFCYHFIPEIVFAPRYSVLVLLLLLAMSYASGKVIVFASDKVKKASR